MSWRARLSTHVKELRFIFNPHKSDSKGIQLFINENYRDLKTLNPRLPFVVRTTESDVPAMVYIQPKGLPSELEFTVSNWDTEKINERLADVVKRAEDPKGKNFLSFIDEDNKIWVKNQKNVEAAGLFKVHEAGRDLAHSVENSNYTKERTTLKLLFIEKYRQKFQDLIDSEWKNVKRNYNAELDRIDQRSQTQGLDKNQIADEVDEIDAPLLPGSFQNHVLNVATSTLAKEIASDSQFSSQLEKVIKERRTLESESNPQFAKVRQEIENAARIARQRDRGDASTIGMHHYDPAQGWVENHSNSVEEYVNRLLLDEYERPDVQQEWFNIIDVNNPPKDAYYKIRI